MISVCREVEIEIDVEDYLHEVPTTVLEEELQKRADRRPSLGASMDQLYASILQEDLEGVRQYLQDCIDTSGDTRLHNRLNSLLNQGF